MVLAEVLAVPVDKPSLQVDFFIRILEIAKLSMRATLKKLLEPLPDICKNKRNPSVEIFSHIEALNFGVSYLQKYPFSSELLKKLHIILMKDKEKFPGEFRRKFIWCDGETIKTARFVPPPFEHIDELMRDLESFWHNDDLNIPELIKVALIEYQYITIHPFFDGNGRLSRLLVTLQLMDKGILKKPVLYFSEFQNRYKQEFKESLFMAHKGDLEQRLRFFILGMVETAKSRVTVLRQYVKLRRKYEDILCRSGNEKQREFFYSLFSNPIIDMETLWGTFDINYDSACSLVRDFEKIGLLKRCTIMKKKYFVFHDYIEMFLKSSENII